MSRKIETNVVKPNSKFEYNENQYLLLDADVEKYASLLNRR